MNFDSFGSAGGKTSFFNRERLFYGMKFQQIIDSIFTIEDFMTRAKCLERIALSEKNGFELAKVNTAAGSKVRTDIRNNN